ncbi:unnamed protein product [Alopecurus aequalis]
MGKDEEDKEANLPEDLLADILGRLAPRWLAVSCCVCKSWKATIDARCLLRTYRFLPLRLEGIFMYFTRHKFPEFFSRPDAPITGKMDFLPSANNRIDEDRCEVQDHCNGLLLLQDESNSDVNYVVNPATRRWDPLPDRPPVRVMGVDCGSEVYLAFDPMVSPHYEVFMIPYFRWVRDEKNLDPSFEESEWPPETSILSAFLSRTCCWEPRSFHREGDALGTVADMRARSAHTCSWWRHRRRAIFWRATLYVHCDKNFLMRISLSKGTLRAIELPEGAISNKYTVAYLGRSKQGVYFASLYTGKLRVWILNDPCGKMEWMLKHEHDLVLPRHVFGRQVGPWVLQDTNYNFFRHRIRYIKEDEFSEEEFEWSSDEDYDVVDAKDMAEESYGGDITILGFHPFKEIIFLLLVGLQTPLALAYRYNSLKAEVLGNVDPKGYTPYFTLPNDARTIEGFPALLPSLHPTIHGSSISANFLDFLPTTVTPSSTPWLHYEEYDETGDYSIIDHCNGILLLEDYVVNPATRRWAPLPPRPSNYAMGDVSFVEEYIVFDPTVSLHYEVFRIPYVVGGDLPVSLDGSKWPPPTCVMHCFSSRTDRWEERSFVRQGEAAGIVADMTTNMDRDYAAYWRGPKMEHPLVTRLADDELADVLRRLAPLCLAASRCVCKAWQTLIDHRRLLSDLLPLSLSSIFIHLDGHRFAELFSRPSSSSTSPAISANFLDILPTTLTPSSTPYFNGDANDYHIIDHCNGLLLLEHYVVNPATRRWAPLPPRPSGHAMGDVSFVEEYIVFDPMVSLHYEVFRIPYVTGICHDDSSF